MRIFHGKVSRLRKQREIDELKEMWTKKTLEVQWEGLHPVNL